MPEKEKLNAAFKEWAAVVRALEDGKQPLILRKGGIHETFELLHSRFLFFPTYEHQKPSDLDSRGKVYLEETLQEAGGRTAPAMVKVASYGEVTDEFWIEDFDRLRALSPYYVWSEEGVKKKFEWQGNGVRLFIVRVYRLPETARIPWNASFGGCRSWIEMKEGIPIEGAEPVLPASRFDEIRTRITGMLAKEEI